MSDRNTYFFDIDFLKEMFFPSVCCGCGRFVDAPGLCSSCWANINWINDPRCAVCGKPFPVEIMPICPNCSTNKPYFDKAVSVMVYDDYSKNMILKFKNADATYLTEPFAKMMYKTAVLEIESSDTIVPVPIYFLKRLKRKYNQAELLGKYISNISKINYEPRVLEKIRKTIPQEGLSGAERRKNIAGSFGINLKYRDLIRDKDILLVDDVFTTGATVNECSKILKESGAKKVRVITLAKVVLSNCY